MSSIESSDGEGEETFRGHLVKLTKEPVEVPKIEPPLKEREQPKQPISSLIHKYASPPEPEAHREGLMAMLRRHKEQAVEKLQANKEESEEPVERDQSSEKSSGSWGGTAMWW